MATRPQHDLHTTYRFLKVSGLSTMSKWGGLFPEAIGSLQKAQERLSALYDSPEFAALRHPTPTQRENRD